MSTLLAGSLPSSLTNQAVEAWKESGVEGLEGATNAIAATMTPEQVSDSLRQTERLSKIVQENCIIPFLSNESPESIEFTDEWKEQAIEGLKLLDPEFDVETFNPIELVLDPRDLDDADATWLLFTWAAGLASGIELKGGGVMKTDDLRRFPQPLARSSRAGIDEQQVRHAA